MLLRSGLAAGLVAATVAVGAAAATAQRSTADRPPSLAIASLTGADTYSFYCAPCHGRDGKGQGPVAAALKTLPADLTQLTSRNKGVFPKEQVRAFITSGTGDVLAHGSPDMPIWGPTFRALETSDKLVNVRIFNVVSYLESIQQ
jgi:mono/diheme cytochrome c family protein